MSSCIATEEAALDDKPWVNIETRLEILMDPGRYGRIYEDLSPGQRFIIQRWFNDQVARVSSLVAEALGSQVDGVDLIAPSESPN